MPIQNTSLSATRECTTQLGIEPNAGNATGLTYRHLDGLRANTEPQVGSDANLSTPHGCAREIVLRALDELRPNPRNARRHPKRKIRDLANHILKVGFIGAIIIDETPQ